MGDTWRRGTFTTSAWGILSTKIISDGELTNQNAAPYKERTATADEARPIQGHRIAAVMLASHVRCLINARPAQKWEGHASRPYGTLAYSSLPVTDFGSRIPIRSSREGSLSSYLSPQRAQHGHSPRSCESPHPSPHLKNKKRGEREKHAQARASARTSMHQDTHRETEGGGWEVGETSGHVPNLIPAALCVCDCTLVPATARMCVCSRGRDLQVLPRVACCFVNEVRHRTSLIDATSQWRLQSAKPHRPPKSYFSPVDGAQL